MKSNPTDAELIQWLIRVKTGWPQNALSCGATPMRDAARKRGWVEVRRTNGTHGPYRTYITRAGLDAITDVPGSHRTTTFGRAAMEQQS